MTRTSLRLLPLGPRFLLIAVTALVAWTGPAGAQEATGVAGQVMDAQSRSPLIGARVVVVGTALTATTNAEGRYRITGVPLGTQTIRVSHIGYGSLTGQVSIRTGHISTADLALSLTPYSLDEIVTTATGDQLRKEVGHAVSTVEVTELAKAAPIQNLGDLLAARAPSVSVLPGNITGGGARVRIRGNSSISLSNNPIYVLDGVKIWSDVNSSSIGIGGTNPGRINDLNPEDIESIDVVRGPSASTLYGTDAANGVIVIKTKHGRAGRPVWNSYAEQGFINATDRWPTAYRGWRTGTTAGTTSTISNAVQCFLFEVAAGTCAQDSLTAFNLFKDPDASPNGTGHRQQYGLQVSGGSDVVTYYLSGEWEDELGYLRMPKFAETFALASRNLLELPSEAERPNALRRTNLRANLNAHLGQKIDVTVNSGFVSSSQRLPQTDNNTTGLLSNGYGGPGFKNNQVVHLTGTPARTNYGYRLYTPDEFFNETVTQDINRTILSGTMNFRPLSWLSFRSVLGVDFTSREDADICRRDECTPFVGDFSLKLGYKTNNRTTNWTYTGDVSGTATYKLAQALGARTTLGTQYSKERFARNGAFSWDLPPGASTVTAGANPDGEELTSEASILGYFAEQLFTWRDRVFITGALRTDRNNAFGQDFNRVFYPKASLSWVLSDEGFFPKAGWLSNLRLRAAYGASGRQPGVNDALSFFEPSTSRVDNVDSPSLIFSAQGNKQLKPERAEELEFGFDAAFLKNRLNLELTYYNKNSRDALLSRPLPPSLGTAPSRWENLGKVNNRGFEAVLNATILDQKSIGWDVTFGGNWGSNEVKDMGDVAPITGATTTTQVGLPIQAWYLPKITWKDTNTACSPRARSPPVTGISSATPSRGARCHFTPAWSCSAASSACPATWTRSSGPGSSTGPSGSAASRGATVAARWTRPLPWRRRRGPRRSG